MPAVFPVYDPFNKDYLELSDKERTTRKDDIDVAWNYYDGNHREPLKVTGTFNDNVIVNLTGNAVDKTTEFTGIPEVALAGGSDNVPSVNEAEGLQTIVSDEQQVLDELVQHLDLSELIPDTLTAQQVAGHSFWRILLPDNTEMVSPKNMPKLALLDARHMTVFWNVSNVHQVLWYRLTWQIGSTQRIQDIVPNSLPRKGDEPGTEREVGWQIIEYESKNGTKFEWIGEDEWAYPFPPIIDYKNRRRPHQYYGESDMRDVRLNDAYNFIASNTARIIKHHAHPKTFITGGSLPEVTETAVDGVWELPNPEAKVSNLEMQDDLQSSMKMMDILRSAYFSQRRVVDVSTMKDRIGQMTNFGVRMLFADMLDMVGDKQARVGDALAEILRRMMAMIGHEIEMPLVTWSDPLPTNRLELVETVTKEADLGLTSGQTLAKDLKRDFVAEQQMLIEEGNAQFDATTDALLRAAQVGAA